MRSESIENDVARARRQFLARCGKFAVATPPAISLLLAASRANYAVASSGGGGGGGGSAGTAGNAPALDPSMGSGGSGGSGGITNAAVTTNTSNVTGGQAAGRSCGNTFQALVNNDKCFR
jgi:hypothetical protein